MTLLLIALGALVIAGVIPAVLPRVARVAVFSILAIAGLGLAGFVAGQVLWSGHPISGAFELPLPLAHMTLELDMLSAFFAFVIALGGIAGTLYGAGYLEKYRAAGRSLAGHLLFFGLFLASMLLVVMAREALTFLVAWELMGLSSLVLVGFDRDKEEVRNATVNYLLWMHVAFVLLLAGFTLLMSRAGSGAFSAFSAVLAADPEFAEGAMLVIFAGFAIKAGFIPFHSWLPIAHPAAPSHVSGLMSGVMIKTGIYGMMRFVLIGGVPTTRLAYIVLTIAVVSSVLGVLYALAQHDLKKLLAYHSVENIGIIGIGVGLGMLGLKLGIDVLVLLGFGGALLHVLNHAIFKGLLFYGAGAVYQATHTRDIERLGGLAKRMPLTATMFLIGSVAITGLPPLNGFISEFVLYSAMLRGAPLGSEFAALAQVLTVGALALTGALALYCFTKAFGIVFLGMPRTSDVDHAVEPGKPMLFGMGLLALFTAVIGLVPAVFFRVAAAVATSYSAAPGLLVEIERTCAALWQVSLVMGIAVALFVVLFGLRHVLLSRSGVRRGKTWDCGYQAGNVRMQYTASSFASPLLSLIARPFMLRKHLEKPEGLFPTSSSFESHCPDAVDKLIIHPLSRGVRYLFSLFRWVQSGDLAQYILYGVLFLIGALLWTMGGQG